MPQPRVDRQPSLSELLDEQHGVATREQLSASGFSEGRMIAELEGRRWRRLNEHVVVTHNGPLTRRQAMQAVVLSASCPVCLCSVTAFELFGVPSDAEPTIHVLVPRGGRVLQVPGVRVKVHESRRFPASVERMTRDGLPVTTLARATVDAAAWCPNVHKAWRLMVAPVQARLVHPADVAGELEKAGRIRHRGTLRLLLTDLMGGAQALSEVEFLAFCRRHGFDPSAWRSTAEFTSSWRSELATRSRTTTRISPDSWFSATRASRSTRTIPMPCGRFVEPSTVERNNADLSAADVAIGTPAADKWRRGPAVRRRTSGSRGRTPRSCR